ncbi:4'-phosphopantetheinyl transferase family protein [Lactococcus lactis]|uniref:4'-phosphopantetheinyl transferase family protein n=1 Tax=Lactococcus lactis TaxID=1358 RepID=UPI0011110E3F|nr:4'-phosphopantetheinyl transferase family protein [Lactococcus lactis]
MKVRKLTRYEDISNRQCRVIYIRTEFFLAKIIDISTFFEKGLKKMGRKEIRNTQSTIAHLELENLKNKLSGNFSYSISHSHQYTCFVITKYKRIGVDIEKNRWEKSRELFLCANERKLLQEVKRGFTFFWTLKESIYKSFFKSNYQISNICISSFDEELVQSKIKYVGGKEVEKELNFFSTVIGAFVFSVVISLD